MALRQNEDYAEVIRQYESLRGDVPPWITVAAADSYLYMQEPETALKLYRSVLAAGYDSPNTTMALYYTLIELGRYKEATKVLNDLDEKTPVQIVERGILQDNPLKEEIAVNKGWLLFYQDRFAEAQKYLESLLKRAPEDTNIRTALAHAYLYRGWPRRAIAEFEVIRQVDPKDTAAQIGYTYALDANGQGEIQSAHAAARPHRKTFRQPDARVFLHVEQLPENSLFRMVRTRRVARRRADAAIFLPDQILGGQLLHFAVAPFFANLLV